MPSEAFGDHMQMGFRCAYLRIGDACRVSMWGVVRGGSSPCLAGNCL